MNTTNISDLPTSPQTKNENEPNIVLGIKQNEKIANPMRNLEEQRVQEQNIQNSASAPASAPPPPATIQSQKQMNQVVNGIQQAIASGATGLPSRDIPRETHAITQDKTIKPNFVPPPHPHLPPNYIDQYETNKEIIRKNLEQEKTLNTTETLYEELQVPVLLAVLYFFFQLPFFRQKFFQFIPSFFNKDGNPKASANLVNSLLFALMFYLLQKGMHHLSQM
jgi:hypothetical protein